MTAHLNLPEKHKKEIKRLIRQYLPDVEVWVYGSRITDRSHEGSDLDLVLRTENLKPVEYDDFSTLKEALTESNIPFLVEIRDWAQLPESFHSEIEREHFVLVVRVKDGGDC